jgi:assimilatory nitrate reductase catalytic subunit
MTGIRLSTSVEPDRLVKTHCCFCGQQCGIQLKVRDNEVIGFEPWEEFPFNRGMLCPKGVKRYLQGSHPDRLLTALQRDPSAASGFSDMPYDRAIARVAAEIDRLQSAHGAGAVGVLGGASLTTEKTYLLGKFARVCLKTPFIDYNGRLCMVSAGAANKKAFGIDRTTNPWSDMIGTGVIWVAGSNVAECSPITTNYIWQARELGAKVIVQDPRITPVARTCDLYLPVKPGRDAALFAGVLQIMIERDWLDHAFIAAHTTGFDQVAEYCRQWTLARTAEVTGVPARSLMQAAEWWGTATSSFLFHARGIEHHSNGVQNSLGTINLVLASGRIGKPKSGYGTIVGQANGQGGREHGQKCDQLPGWRDISNPEHRQYIAGVWGIDEREMPGPGVDAYEMFRKIDTGEIKGLISICFNPKVSLPDNAFVTRCLEKLEFYTAIDFFLNDTARHADIVLPGSLHEEDEGTVTQVEGRIIKVNKAVDCPGEAREDWRIIQDIAAALQRPKGFTFNNPREIFEELRVASRGGVADYSGVTYEKIEREMGVFWPCYSHDPKTGAALADHPGTPRLFEAGSYNPVARGSGPFYFPDGRARFNVADYRVPIDDASEEYPIFLTTGRVVSQFLSGTQTRRIGPLVKQYPEPRIEMHPKLAAKLGIADGDWATAETRRGAITLKASVVTTIRPDTIFVPYHWAGKKSINQLTVAAQDPISKIPQYKVCGCRVFKAAAPPDYDGILEPQQ